MQLDFHQYAQFFVSFTIIDIFVVFCPPVLLVQHRYRLAVAVKSFPGYVDSWRAVCSRGRAICVIINLPDDLSSDIFYISKKVRAGIRRKTLYASGRDFAFSS